MQYSPNESKNARYWTQIELREEDALRTYGHFKTRLFITQSEQLKISIDMDD